MLILFYGCATNPFSQYYYDQTGGIDLTQYKHVIIPESEPQVFRGNDQETDLEKMMEDGYFLIGYSSFNAGNVNERGATYQGKKVHATVVLLYSQYTNTVSGSLPLTLPDNRTSTTYDSGSLYGSGNVYGSGGSAYYSGTGTYSGSSTTTTYGSKTTYIPYNVRRHDYLAVYYGKTKGSIFGAHVVDLSQDEKSAIESNTGVKISVVVKGSPAYRNDFFKGDILKTINKFSVYDTKEYYDMLKRFAGQQVIIKLIRNGNLIEKELYFNDDPAL